MVMIVALTIHRDDQRVLDRATTRHRWYAFAAHSNSADVRFKGVNACVGVFDITNFRTGSGERFDEPQHDEGNWADERREERYAL
jgi:hypothetical protein